MKTVRRYANCCFKAAKELGAVEDLISDFTHLENVFEQFHAQFLSINNQISELSHRLAFVDMLSKQLKLNDLTHNLLKLLACNRRLNLVGDISAYFLTLGYKDTGRVQLTVVSVNKISNASAKNIENVMQKTLNKKILIDNVIDESIIGGLIMKFGSFVIDDSVANKLRNMELLVKNAN